MVDNGTNEGGKHSMIHHGLFGCIRVVKVSKQMTLIGSCKGHSSVIGGFLLPGNYRAGHIYKPGRRRWQPD